jgi:hypothetical protein
MVSTVSFVLDGLREIFLQSGLDTGLVIYPSGKSPGALALMRVPITPPQFLWHEVG